MRILLVEDEEKVAGFIKKGLEQSGYVVDWVANGNDAFNYGASSEYDAILMDLMLPDRDGLSVVAELRQKGITTPVLALTARGGLDDRIDGLNSGCDDYLAKPFAFDELVARLRALIRRAAGQKSAVLEYSGLIVDPLARTVTRGGQKIELTNKEFALLDMLIRHPGQVFTRTSLMESVWGYDFDTSSNVLEVYINFLRKKIDHKHTVKLLHTVRGVGYVLRSDG